nr:IncF plasmid conjugative transfer pilus assembly protein TraC [Escherichia coli]
MLHQTAARCRSCIHLMSSQLVGDRTKAGCVSSPSNRLNGFNAITRAYYECGSDTVSCCRRG